MKKNLIYILHDIQIGGVEVALISAIPKLTEVFNIKIVALGAINPKLIENLNLSQRSVFKSFNYPLYLYPFAVFKICWFILKLKPEIMICSLWRASLIGLLIKILTPGIKFYSFIHNTTFFHFFDSYFSRAAIKASDVVLVDSNAAITFLRNFIPAIKPVREISMLTSKPLRAFQQRPVPVNEVRFFFLGRIHSQKNLSLAVEVIKMLRDKNINAVLDIYGRDAGDMTLVKSVIQSYNLEHAVYFCGEVTFEDKTNLFSNYDFYIQLSHVEGMAMSVAESMQNGLVCIVTPVGEIPYYSEHMKSAIWFDKNDVEGSIETIISVLNHWNKYTEISSNAYYVFKEKDIYSDSLLKNIF